MYIIDIIFIISDKLPTILEGFILFYFIFLFLSIISIEIVGEPATTQDHKRPKPATNQTRFPKSNANNNKPTRTSTKLQPLKAAPPTNLLNDNRTTIPK